MSPPTTPEASPHQEPKVFVLNNTTSPQSSRLNSSSRAQFATFRRVLHQTCRFKDWSEQIRVLDAYKAMKQDFDALRKDGKPKMRRTGEPLYLHPAGVAMMLMEEFGENDPDLLVEALYHDHGEDILWNQVRRGPDDKHWKWILRFEPIRTMSKLVVPRLSKLERNDLRSFLRQRSYINKSNVNVITALTIEKKLALIYPDKNLYLNQIKELYLNEIGFRLDGSHKMHLGPDELFQFGTLIG